ncbi:hypothetical protein [Pedobacter sp. NJ-S-72]
MRKIYLHVLLLFLGVLGAQGQIKVKPAAADSSNYQSRKLKIDEINLVSAYYHQNGNNSAVTGGIGTEKLTDFANTIIDLQLSKFNKAGKKKTPFCSNWVSIIIPLLRRIRLIQVRFLQHPWQIPVSIHL